MHKPDLCVAKNREKVKINYVNLDLDIKPVFKAKKYYSNLGFIKDKLSSIVELTIFSDDIANKINKIETGSSFNMKKTRFTQKEFDLAEIMKLD